MKHYQSKSGKPSGVTAFELHEESITVKFNDLTRYLYTYGSCGKTTVETMKLLAKKSEGLSTFISRNEPDYEQKFEY